MDKRWIGILIILIIGGCCMYYVVDNSTTVGTAISVVNKTIVTLPDGFSIEDKDKDDVNFIDWDTNEKISINDLGKGDISSSSFESRLKELKKNGEFEIIGNSTTNIGNITLYKLDYINSTSEDALNISESFVFTCNHTFLIKTKGYSDEAKLNKDLAFLVNTMIPDYKQSQD